MAEIENVEEMTDDVPEEVEFGGEEDALLNPEQDEAEEQRQYSRALTAIKALITDCAEGRGDHEADALKLAEGWNELVEYTKKRFSEVRAALPPSARPVNYGGLDQRRPGAKGTFSRLEVQPEAVAQPEIAPKAEEEFAEAVEAELGVRFHPSDLAKDGAQPPTIEERDAAFEKMADLRKPNPLEYVKLKREWAKKLGVDQATIHDTVTLIIDERGGEGKQSQATQVVAICVGDKERVQLWCSEEGEGHASVLVGGHWENHRLESRTFNQWLHYEYGQQYQTKIGDEWHPKVPGDSAVKDAIKQLNGIARFNEDVRVPAYRVGGNREAVWIDLGTKDWCAVQVTAQGWDIVSAPGVQFVRKLQMGALPMPMRGGKIGALRELINVRPGDLVLAIGWLLQALNPIGPYPIVNVCGQSEAGKTTAAKTMLRVVDPTSTSLRRSSRKTDDVLIAARNGWAIGIDNVSTLSVEMSDIFCTVSTGISTGTRAHYTNDEEHSYYVERPVIFNGIEEDLVSRGDLASRVIKLMLLPITKRRTKEDLDLEFLRVWPEVFGALLDGLVGAMQDHGKIDVKKDHGTDPARLMDFEQFAEAGCRAMGFKEWEFVDAYAMNRRDSMANALERSMVGRAVWTFMKKHPDGFAGKLSILLPKLDNCRDNFPNPASNDWPKTPGKLSDALGRLVQPLAAVAIDCRLQQDRRKDGGSQFDVVVAHRTPR